MTTVRVRATELDVYVDGDKVGRVMDCGDCWRASVDASGHRRARALKSDFDTRSEAVRAVVAASGSRAP
jgi:hypothetical protein